MQRLYSQTTGSTYFAGYNPDIPADAVKISEECFMLVIGNPDPAKVRSHDDTGLPILIDPPTAHQEAATKEMFSRAVQDHLDSVARDSGYGGILSAVSYLGDTNPKFDNDAKSFFAWRGAVWTYVYAQLALVQAGTVAQPTIDAFIASLPALKLSV